MWCADEIYNIDKTWRISVRWGWFGLIAGRKSIRVVMWNPCRDTWHFYTSPGNLEADRFDDKIDVNRFVYMLGEEQTRKSLVTFMDKVEGKLKISPKIRSRFGPTSEKGIVWCKPSWWWQKCHMRRALFTALMRDSKEYHVKKDDFDEVLRRGRYTGYTIDAVNMFLKGRTVYSGPIPATAGDIPGWVSTFRHKTNEEIKDLLVRPGRRKKKSHAVTS